MSAYTKVVVGTDGSESSYRAVDRAARLAADAGATLVQAYSGFIYGGASWPGRLNRQLG